MLWPLVSAAVDLQWGDKSCKNDQQTFPQSLLLIGQVVLEKMMTMWKVYRWCWGQTQSDDNNSRDFVSGELKMNNSYNQ